MWVASLRATRSGHLLGPQLCAAEFSPALEEAQGADHYLGGRRMEWESRRGFRQKICRKKELLPSPAGRRVSGKPTPSKLSLYYAFSPSSQVGSPLPTVMLKVVEMDKGGRQGGLVRSSI